ncbi:hypothetical protein KDL01_28295 [Actinospica durhamensis]|uniref:Secreted protein n=1 Tax=Actinospica durhamensis TaxID=1508375 RepID=A0A941ETV9_9ACTN|nr:hypothetical protein [Actinospica durhamensis]MBR7837211.1 hypothetical protein [Actinospica durhamensis]
MAILITIIVIVVLAAAAVTAWWSGKRRLRAAFGPELDTVAQDYGSTRQVDRELRRRKKEHDALQLTPISAEDQAYYATTWEHLQGEFLDDPSLSLNSAERLVATVLKARGYPGEDEQEQLALLSVEHAGALADYRAAQQTNRRAVEDPTSIPTEELRQAILSYYTLFNELIADPGAQPDAPAEGAVSSRTSNSQEATR